MNAFWLHFDAINNTKSIRANDDGDTFFFWGRCLFYVFFVRVDFTLGALFMGRASTTLGVANITDDFSFRFCLHTTDFFFFFSFCFRVCAHLSADMILFWIFRFRGWWHKRKMKTKKKKMLQLRIKNAKINLPCLAMREWVKPIHLSLYFSCLLLTTSQFKQTVQKWKKREETNMNFFNFTLKPLHHSSDASFVFTIRKRILRNVLTYVLHFHLLRSI